MKNKLIFSVLACLLTTGVLSLVFLNGFFFAWQNKLADSLFLPKTQNANIVLITIDDKSIATIGRFPWPRRVYSQLLQYLGNQPLIVGMDIAFPESTSDDNQLARIFKQNANVVLSAEAENLTVTKQSITAPSILLPNATLRNSAYLGITNTLPDDDGITRLTPLYITSQNQTFANFSLAILQHAYQVDNKFVNKLNNTPTENGLLRINYEAAPQSFARYSFADVLNKKIPQTAFEGKIVLIGATAADLHDTQLTPISFGSPESGIEIHAQTLQTLLSGQFLSYEPTLATIATILLLSLLIALLFLYVGVIRATFLTVILAAVFLLYVFISFDFGIIRNIVYPLLTILLLYIANILYNYFIENKQRRFLRRAFSFYVSEPVLAELIKHPQKLKLGGEKKTITVLFSDIAGFTAISETLDPEVLTTLLNEYLTAMTNIVFANSGVLDKYIGDAVMAFWGAPIDNKDHALLACKTALAMQEEIQKLQKVWQEHGVNQLEVRIGINTGKMVVGNMGSDSRFDYTLLGDNVNLGSRLEGINKEYGTNSIISKTTYDMVKDEVVARQLDTVAVKGKKQGVIIYELIALGNATSQQQEFLKEFEQARAMYEKGKFKEAKSAFTNFSKQYPQDTPTTIYLSRLDELLHHPPTSWDGIFRPKTK